MERDGETLVERRGRPIASIAPAAAASGSFVKDLLRAQPADTGWARERVEFRAASEPEDRRWTA